MIPMIFGIVGCMDANRAPPTAHLDDRPLYTWRGNPYANVNQLARLLARGVLSEQERKEVELIIRREV